jgi:hypothetical protein
MAYCYQDLLNWAKAEKAWRHAILANGKKAEWHYHLGVVLLLRRGQKDEAVRKFAEAVKMAGGTRPAWLPDAHRHLGTAYRSTDKGKAVHHFQEYLRLAPADGAYRDDVQREIERLSNEASGAPEEAGQ